MFQIVMSNFNYQNMQSEQMGGVITNFFGHILPDFGFPDKKMWYVLREKYPAENWDRFQTYDIYKWYESGIEAGQPPYDIDTGNSQIFNWMKSNSTYTNIKIDHWKDAFVQGIYENWVSGKIIGTQLAPAHEGRELAEGFASIPNTFGGLWNKILLTGAIAGGLAVVYYGGPMFKKITKKKR